VAAVDEGVGQILDELDRSRLAKNTIVVYASDQGFFLGENGWYDKRWFYEPSAGTPLLIRLPGREGRGRAVSTPTSNVDLAPTILEWAGIEPPPAMQGESLMPLIRQERVARGPVYGHFYESDDADHKAPKYVAIATQRHKLICYYELEEWELFDLAKDPDETRNLWPEKIASATRHEMVRKLLAKQRELREEPALIGRVASLSAAMIR
jgi:arylsulfatase A-like enzyme